MGITRTSGAQFIPSKHDKMSKKGAGKLTTVESHYKRRWSSMSTEKGANEQEEGVVLLERKGAIAVMTLSRPAALNALTSTMYQQMDAHLETLAIDTTI